MSWESTVSYYQIINRKIAAERGGLHSAEILLRSVDFHRIETLQRAGRWEEAGHMLSEIAVQLEAGGARILVLCTNTMHRVAEQIESCVAIPLLHIADATAAEIKQAGLSKVGLLGTQFTMQQDFYRGRLERQHGLEIVSPGAEAQLEVHRIIYEELCQGKVIETSRARYRHIAEQLVEQGCQGVILGCTEIGLLLRAGDCSVPLFDTARIHAEAAANWALGNEVSEVG